MLYLWFILKEFKKVNIAIKHSIFHLIYNIFNFSIPLIEDETYFCVCLAYAHF
jgi:hypothetical protein